MSKKKVTGTQAKLDEESLEFRMVLKAFEVAVYLAHYFELCSGETLELLLHKATMRVQLGMNMTVAEQAMKLDCCERTVNARRQKLLEPVEKSTFRLMLQLVQSGQHTRESILANCRETFGFDVVEVGLDMLTRQGYIEPMKEGPDAPIIPVKSDSPRDRLDSALRKLELQHLAQLMILETLSIRHHTSIELQEMLKRQNLPHVELSSLLETLERRGQIVKATPPSESPIRWTLRPASHHLVLDQPSLRWRSGMLDMFTLMKRQLTAVFRAPHDETFGQRNFRFTASPDDLKSFLREHRLYVLHALEKLETQANPTSARSYAFTWLMAEQLPEDLLI